jgi:predicted component of type VI protein secretion system
MTTPGQASVCFSCGQPLPLDATAKAPGSYPLTNNVPIPTPPPNPYAAPASAVASAFILTSNLGTFKVSPGGEVLVGRDPARCAIHLTEPRVSGLHATVKVENGALFVRDERSNNGVWINGERTPAGAWAEVPKNASLRFGPIQFSVTAA